MSEIQKLLPAAIVTVALAIAVVTGIIVLVGFKQSGVTDTQANATIDSFILGLAIFGSFIGVIVLAIIGKIIIAMFKKETD